MKKILRSAPLVQAVIHLRFSETPSLSIIDSKLLKTIHAQMINLGFPDFIESTAQSVEFTVDQSSQEVKQRTQTMKRYVFIAAGKTESIELNSTSLIIKSTNYNTFEELSQSFLSAINLCLETVNELQKMLLKSIGLRYVNAIVPKGSNNLESLISKEIIPLSTVSISNSRHLHGSMSKAIETDNNQSMLINFEELPLNGTSVHKILPENSIEPDTNCGLVIKGYSWWANVPGNTYGILDIDHSYNFNSPQFDMGLVESELFKLKQNISSVFWELTSDTAKNAWDYEEINNDME